MRFNLLIIHKAFPRHPRRIEGQITLDVLERLGRRFITPNLAVDGFVVRAFDAPICGSAFPFAQGGFVGDLGQGVGDGG